MISAIITMIFNYIRFRSWLKKCLITDPSTNVEVFEYKGKIYDRKKYIQLRFDFLLDNDCPIKNLKKYIADMEVGLVSSKNPDLSMTELEAYKT